MSADGTVRVDPTVLQGHAVSVGGAAEQLMQQLAQLDDQMGQVLGGWQGTAGSAYASAWRQWHQGAREVQAGLALLAHLVGQASEAYGNNEARSAQAERAVRGG